MSTYRIDDASTRGSAPKMSPFPKRTRPFTEPVTATQDVVLGTGLDLASLIKKYYPGSIPTGFGGNFGFLDRDNKVREYTPGDTDKYVFKSMASVKLFQEEAIRLLSFLTDTWREMGLPIKKDEDRNISVPDTEIAWQALKPDHELHGTVIKNIEAIYFIIANVDIMKKACVVRSVNAGWWAVSYAGKNAPNAKYFSTSMQAHVNAIIAIMKSSKGKALYQKIWAESSDPLTTNPGYPFYTAQMDDKGNPITRIKTVELFRNLTLAAKGSWSGLISEVDARGGQHGMKGFPFCVAPIRRLQPGYKWQHQFTITPSGLRTAFDERGVNSQRVAHMVPYVYNVITAPVSALYKTIRMLLPGCYHDGPAKLKRMKRLHDMHKNKALFLAEADYSNFDRFMAVDLIENIVRAFTDQLPNKEYWEQAMLYLHHDANLVWPDFSSVEEGGGWLFKPGRLGLLSGVKATSDTGTLVNSVVNAEALARLKKWDVGQLTDYLLQYMDSEVGSKAEYFYVQSDDTQLISSSPLELHDHGLLFMDAVKAAGLKGSIELADRFLMRHLQGGSDRPVPARVWQNTLSNESPPASEIIFLAGLGSRTDGLLGIKTVDPFQTGEIQRITTVEAAFTLEVIKSVRRFVSTAARPSSVAVEICDTFLTEQSQIDEKFATDPSMGYSATPTTALKLGNIRRYITQALAKVQLEESSPMSETSVRTWLYNLYKDQNIPSTSLMLEQLRSLDARLNAELNTFKKKDEAFFQYATSTIGVRPLNL